MAQVINYAYTPNHRMMLTYDALPPVEQFVKDRVLHKSHYPNAIMMKSKIYRWDAKINKWKVVKMDITGQLYLRKPPREAEIHYGVEIVE